MTHKRLSRRSFIETSVLGATVGTGIGTVSTVNSAVQEKQIIPVKLGSNEKLKIAILGCGNRSRTHIEAVNYYHDRMEIIAMCDILPEMLEEKQKLVKAGKPRLYTDYEKMLKQEDLHAVAVVLPNTVHRNGTIASLEAGKHVLCEKPLTIDVSETRDIIQASKRTRRIVQVGTQSRHSAGYNALAAKLREGLIGRPLYGWAQNFRMDWRKIYPDPKVDSKRNWRMKQSEGGSVVYEMGIHTIDVFNWLIDSEPEEITCLGGTHNKKLQKRDSWDHAGVVVRYENGAMMNYGGNLYSCGGQGPDVLFGDEMSLVIPSRSAGSTTMYRRPYRRPHGMQESAPAEVKKISLPKSGVNPSIGQFEYFLEAVQGKKPVFPSAEDHLPAVIIARGSQMSVDERRHVKASEVI